MVDPAMPDGTDRSRTLHGEALGAFPGGVSHNVRHVEPYPLYVDRAEGPHVWDVDGNRYVDFWNNHHASVLGHAPDRVVEAVREQAARGLHYGAPNEPALELARLALSHLPGADRLRFCASGTEATMYAVRLARAHTGRPDVLKVEAGWHGGNTDLSYAVSAPFDAPDTAGLPPGAAEHVSAFELNDPASLRDTWEGRDVAAVILDPRKAGVEPTPEFLSLLADECADRGTLLILDEVVTGFRLEPGSYAARAGLEPDLTALGKFLGGGLPVGAIAGRADVFVAARPDVAAEEPVLAGGGTFSVNPMTATAGLAGLRALEEEPVHEHVEAMGERVREGLSAVFREEGADATALGVGSLFRSAFAPEGPLESPTDVRTRTDPEAYAEFHRRLLARGIYFLPGHMGNVTYATTRDHVDELLSAARAVVREMRGDGRL